MKTMIPALVLVPFTAFSLFVVFEKGFFGFLTLASHDLWGLQILLDLFLSLFLVSGWLRRDAREHGISATPYLVLLPILGSIPALAYLVHRSLRSRSVSVAALP